MEKNQSTDNSHETETKPKSSPQPDEPAKGTTGWKEAATGVAALLTLIAALTYPLGLVARNSYLNQFGVAEFSLPSSQYISAGLWTIFWLGFGLLFPAITFLYWLIEGRINKGLMVAAVAFFALQFLLAAGGIPRGRSDADSALSILDAEVFFGLFLLFGAMIFLAKGRTKDNLSTADRKAWAVVLAYVIVAAPLIYAATFGKSVLPKLPGQLGGGRSSHIQLLIKPEAVDAVALLGITFQKPRPNASAAALTEDLEVLFENEHFYLVRTADKKVIEVDKSEKLGAIPRL